MNTEKVRIDKDGDVISLTVGLYKLFLANGKEGRIAKDVYEHLLFTARIQETDQVWAKNIYIKNGLKIGEASVKKAKTFLRKHGLIEYIQDRKDNGTMGEFYILIKHQAKDSTAGSNTALVDNHTIGSKKQILKTRNLNAVREKKKEREEQTAPLSKPTFNKKADKANSVNSIGALAVEVKKVHRAIRGTPLIFSKKQEQKLIEAQKVAGASNAKVLFAYEKVFLKDKYYKKSGYSINFFISQMAECLNRAEDYKSSYLGQNEERLNRKFYGNKSGPYRPPTEEERENGKELIKSALEIVGLGDLRAAPA